MKKAEKLNQMQIWVKYINRMLDLQEADNICIPDAAEKADGPTVNSAFVWLKSVIDGEYKEVWSIYSSIDQRIWDAWFSLKNHSIAEMRVLRRAITRLHGAVRLKNQPALFRKVQKDVKSKTRFAVTSGEGTQN